jgi:hypothetical protein
MRWLWSVHDEVNEHKRRYAASGLREAARRAGFSTLALRYWGCALVPAAYLGRRLCRSAARPGAYRVAVPPAPVNGLLSRLVYAEYLLTSALPPPFGLSLIAAFEQQ